MTQSAHRPRAVYLGTGGGTLGPFSLVDENGNAIYFAANADVLVTRYGTDGTKTVLTEGTHYTLTGGPSTGSLTLTSASGVLVTNEKLVIERRQTIAQLLDIANASAFAASDVETRLDIAFRVMQELNDQIGRALPLSKTELTGYELPPARNRGPADSIQKVLGFSVTTGEPTLVALTDVDATAIPADILAALVGATSLADLLGNLGAISAAGGRLTLTSGTPVLTGDVTAATSIYYTPFTGGLIPIYDGDEFITTAFSELALALSSNSGHTGYHQSGKNFDLFVFNDSGTVRLGSGPAWSSDTARAEAVSRVQGIYVNTSSITLRYGSASGDTVSVAANRATLVGTFRASANGQTQVKFGSSASGGGEAWFGLWNLYNRRRQAFKVTDSTFSWSYTSATVRPANNSTTNRVSFVRGLNEDAVRAEYRARMAIATTGNNPGVSIGLDSTTAGQSPASSYVSGDTAGYTIVASGIYTGLPGLGFHYLQALEVGDGTNSATFVSNGTLGGMPGDLEW